MGLGIVLHKVKCSVCHFPDGWHCHLRLLTCPKGAIVWPVLNLGALHFPLWEIWFFYLQAQLLIKLVLRVQLWVCWNWVCWTWVCSNLQPTRYRSYCITSSDWAPVNYRSPFPRGCSTVLLLPSEDDYWLANGYQSPGHKIGPNIPPAFKKIWFLGEENRKEK